MPGFRVYSEGAGLLWASFLFFLMKRHTYIDPANATLQDARGCMVRFTARPRTPFVRALRVHIASCLMLSCLISHSKESLKRRRASFDFSVKAVLNVP